MSDRIVSRPSTDKFRENWERIWGEPTVVDQIRDELLANQGEALRRLAIDAFVERNEGLGI